MLSQAGIEIISTASAASDPAEVTITFSSVACSCIGSADDLTVGFDVNANITTPVNAAITNAAAAIIMTNFFVLMDEGDF